MKTKTDNNGIGYGVFCLSIPVTLDTQLTEYKKKTGRSKRHIVQKAIDAYLISTVGESHERSN